MPEKLFFNDSIVSVEPTTGYTETRYDDDSHAPALPTYDPVSLYRANELGYGTNIPLMTIQHELLHTFLCERLGLIHSPTLWSVAHANIGPDCISQERQWEEEALVLSFQKYINNKEVDPVLAELEKNTKLRLYKVKRDALRLLDFTFDLTLKNGME